MKRILTLVLLALLIIDTRLVLAAPQYIDAPALDSVVKTPVGNVKSGTVQLPLITWGADIRTLYANGGKAATDKDSLFGKAGLDLRLQRIDDFKKQLDSYIKGESPYLRGTLGMVNMASSLLARDGRTKPVIIYQLSESAGGDALVVKRGIKNAKGLKGKTIALQAYGPHVDYLTTILKDADLKVSDVTLKWLPDLTGTDNAPMAAFYEKDIDAAMVIIPDALALTSGGNVGSGAEDSVKGARILLSTKTANRVIADVYAVRSDYFKDHREQVEKLVHSLMIARDQVADLVAKKSANADDYNRLMRNAAGFLLDSAEAVSDTEALYGDAQHVDYHGNIQFFEDSNYPRNFTLRSKESQRSFITLGLLTTTKLPAKAGWNYKKFETGLTAVKSSTQPRFKKKEVATVVAKKQQQGNLEEGELFSFEVYFQPNQNTFSAELYEASFTKVVELAATYGGAIITVEGHSDPLGYLKQKKAGQQEIVLKRVKQSAKNLSLTRANSVRDAVVAFAKAKNIVLDSSQFASVGHGISRPKSGLCGADPCAPKNKQEWLNNMRVEFRLIQVEAEADVFQPL